MKIIAKRSNIKCYISIIMPISGILSYSVNAVKHGYTNGNFFAPLVNGEIPIFIAVFSSLAIFTWLIFFAPIAIKMLINDAEYIYCGSDKIIFLGKIICAVHDIQIVEYDRRLFVKKIIVRFGKNNKKAIDVFLTEEKPDEILNRFNELIARHKTLSVV